MPRIVGVRFKAVGKIYFFSPDNFELALNEGVIVETARGIEFGRIAIVAKEVDEKEVVSPLKPIIRKATDADILQVERNQGKRENALREARLRIVKHNLNMKLVDAEFTFDNTKVIFYFTSDSRVDFRELVKDLASCFHIRIELRQIGIRDETKMRGGLSPCGRECCCSLFLPDFERVSIKMAKTQCLSLNPTKISGLCGRLMCCLAHENVHYAEAAKKMPVIGSAVVTADGSGVVTNNNLLKMRSRVRLEAADGSYEFKEYEADQMKPTKLLADTLTDDTTGADSAELSELKD